MPCDPTYVHVGSLEVEPTFLARVYEATWQHTDVEMQKLGRRARGSHAEFHVRELHGFELVFRGTNEASRLVIPASCRSLLLDEVHCSKLAAHFGAKKMHKLLAARVWWPHMLSNCRTVCRSC